jgi:translocation and assembly module TamA
MRLLDRFILHFAILFSGPSLFAALEVQVTGVDPRLERLLLPMATELLADEGGGPTLRQARADATAEALRERLQSLGYLEAAVRSQTRARATFFEVDLGRRFLMDRIRWELRRTPESEEPLPIWPPDVTALLMRRDLLALRGEPLEVEVLSRLQLGIAEEMRHLGYAFAEPMKVRLRADSVTERVNVVIPFSLGDRIHLGRAEVEGLLRLRPEWVERRICWYPGALYNPESLETTRELLLRSGLFNSVEMRFGEKLTPTGNTPVILSLEERKPRTFSAGVTYATTEGFGGLLGWENRNVSGMGERLSADLVIAQILQELTLGGRQAVGDRADQHWLSFGIVRRKHILSYLERSADLALLMEWNLSPSMTTSLGLKVEGMTVRDSPQNGENLIGSLPFFFEWQATDDEFDPKSGGTLLLRAAPTGASGSPSSVFFPFRLSSSLYIPFGNARLACRATFGSIVGAELESIPLPLRFFEGSVEGLRGYAYQTVSPLDPCGIPIGGRSLFLCNFEFRAPITSTIELIPFFDIGNVFADSWPDFDVRPLSSIGLGAKWDSLLGPLRLDIAFPLNRRPTLDKSFFIYFGVGQTF